MIEPWYVYRHISEIAANGQRLAVACSTCNRRSVLTADEAVSRYGEVPTKEAQALIRSRCGRDDCTAIAVSWPVWHGPQEWNMFLGGWS